MPPRAIVSAGVAVAVVLAAAMARSLPERTDPLTGMRFVRIPAGQFTMGTPPDEPQRETQEVPHRVRIEREFYLGVTEVTQGEWTSVMGHNPSHFVECGPKCPVEGVSYSRHSGAAQRAQRPQRLARLPAANGSGMGVRLPRRRPPSLWRQRRAFDRTSQHRRDVSVSGGGTRPVARHDHAERDVCGQPVGTLRHVGQRLGMDV